MILDLLADSYLCVDASSFDRLAPLLQGWPQPEQRVTHHTEHIDHSLADSLVARGILSERPEGTKAARPIQFALPSESLHAESSETMRSYAAYFLPFVYACWIASWRLRKRELSATVRVVRKRKQRSMARSDSQSLNAVTARLTMIFRKLRLFYPREYLCMFDSLALLEFLNLFDVFPDWVFGVRTDPFCAHCWVQTDRMILNDTASRIGGYSPIMVV